MKLRDVNSSFLLKGDLALNLAYYKNLPLDGIFRLYEDKKSDEYNNETSATAELDQSVVIAMWRAFSSAAKVNLKTTTEMIARYYPVFWKEFAYIRNQLSSSVTQNIVIRIFSDEINRAVKDEPLEEKREMIRILSNTLCRILSVKGKDEIGEEWKEIHYDNLLVVKGGKEEKVEEDTEIGNLKRKEEVLKAIHEGGLWYAEVAENAAAYLKKMIKEA